MVTVTCKQDTQIFLLPPPLNEFMICYLGKGRKISHKNIFLFKNSVQENKSRFKMTELPRKQNVQRTPDYNFLHSSQISCVKVEIYSSGVVELRSLLVHPAAVDPAAEVAFIHPALENTAVRSLKPTGSDRGQRGNWPTWIYSDECL